MERQQKAQYKIDILRLITDAAIAVIALGFTILFGFSELAINNSNNKIAQSNLKLAESNDEMVKAQYNNSKVQSFSSLLPYILSDKAKDREIAIHLSYLIDTSMAIAINSLLAKFDPDTLIRNTAIKNLKNLSNITHTEIKEEAQTTLNQFAVFEELKSKNLLTEIFNAQNYLKTGNPASRERALDIYRSVVKRLSSSSRNTLNNKLLSGAEEDYNKQHFDNAIQKYEALFTDIIAYSNKDK